MSAYIAAESHQSVSAQAPAMIALTSNVGQPLGHQRAPVLQLKMAISRYDIAAIEPRDDKEILVSYEDVTQTPIEYQDIPDDDLVAVFRAVDELRDYLARPKVTSGVDITIQKNIPFDTHLGGRGASAAAVLVALARLWNANIAREDLARIAHRIDLGAVESLTGGVIFSSDSATDSTVTQVLSHRELALVIVPAAADVPTDELMTILRGLRADQPHAPGRDRLEFDPALLEALAHGRAAEIALLMHNDFQPAIVTLLPEHNDWLTAGMTEGALAAQTIGPGASLLLLARDFEDATKIAERFEERMEIAAIPEYGPVAGAQVL